ncbi:MAG TPA: M14-type cytosolic carboxypeptidase [Cyclobacteriaceae bacterium]|nr:M14-type cytosolic carboxypeptidase [Cyclobacteriaceae bacterium]
MKIICKLQIIIFILALISCSQKKIRLSADFERGSIGAMEETGPGYFKGNTRHWMKWDNIGNQYYWFYFRAENVTGCRLTVELNDLIGVYRGNPHIVYTDYTQPVFSYDRQNWERITEVAYDSAARRFTFTQQFDRQPVWIAYAHPYTYSRLEEFTKSVGGVSGLEVRTLSKTAEGRDIRMFFITDAAVPVRDKKTILVIAAQHAGEDAGAFLAEGLVSFLISDSPEAAECRNKFNYAVVPLMNPDGFYHGITRYNSKMEDLNSIWTESTRSQPEVEGVKAWVNEWQAPGNKIDLFIDVHNHTQFHDYHIFIMEDNSLDSMAATVNKYWPVRTWHSLFAGSSCAWTFRQGIPSATIELSQGKIGEDHYLAIDDFLGYGKGTAEGLREYFYP